ncbi:hypothetical protein I1700191I7_45850 [Bacteroides ovatus]
MLHWVLQEMRCAYIFSPYMVFSIFTVNKDNINMAVFDGIMSFQAMMNMSTFAAFINCLIYNPIDYEIIGIPC